MAKNKTITVKGTEITIYQGEQSDYISLTNIARHKDVGNTDTIIQNWLRNRNTVELLGFWELIYNPNFKPLEFEGFKKQAGLNSFVLTPKKWIETTGAIGIISKSGRYGEPSRTKILRLNLHPGFPLNSNYTLSKNSSVSKKRKTIACSSLGIYNEHWQKSTTAFTPMPSKN